MNYKVLVGGILCDLEKAFDCVNHDILLSKLKFYRIGDKDITLNQSHLDNRYCRTAIYRLFISPSGISELDCATTKTDTAERSISIGREPLQVFFFGTRGLGVLPGSTARG